MDGLNTNTHATVCEDPPENHYSLGFLCRFLMPTIVFHSQNNRTHRWLHVRVANVAGTAVNAHKDYPSKTIHWMHRFTNWCLIYCCGRLFSWNLPALCLPLFFCCGIYVWVCLNHKCQRFILLVPFFIPYIWILFAILKFTMSNFGKFIHSCFHNFYL